MTSPTQRALADCKKLGWVAGVVEKWNPHAHIRQDLWGWVDIVALDPIHCVVYFIQVTSGSNHASRVAKIQNWEHLPRLAGVMGCEPEVWSYTQKVHRNKDGKKSKVKRWTLRRQKV